MPASESSYTSVWARPAKKERSTLTRGQIVSEAIRLLDSEGIEALSMRKLAARLDAGTTSIYWHVANRDELIELVINEIYGEVDLPGAEADDDWRAGMRSLGHSMRATFVRHPWMVAVFDHLVAGYPGPNAAGLAERMLGLFAAAGFEPREAEHALNTVSAYVSGTAMGEAAWHNWLARHGQSEQEWIDESKRVMEEVSQDHPHLHDAVTTGNFDDTQKYMDEDFEYGLERVLDGLQVRLDRQSSS